jgi:hypothetical protein
MPVADVSHRHQCVERSAPDWSNPAASNAAERAAVQAISDALSGTGRPFLLASGIAQGPGRRPLARRRGKRHAHLLGWTATGPPLIADLGAGAYSVPE